MEFEEKQRIIQEFVPGKQVTLAHVIANPDQSLYKKMGVIGEHTGALGIMTITPSEGAIIGADMETSVREVMSFLENTLKFAPTIVTKS